VPFLLKLILIVPLVLYVLWSTGQVRKPSGALGKRVLHRMNESHSALTDWGLKQVTVPGDGAILDVGCGGGRTVQKLAAMAPEGRVVGVDFSEASVAASRELNAPAIDSGRVRIELASVASLPFPDRDFDVVTAVETHYYWPDLAANLREVLRVMKPGGTLAVISETHRDGVAGVLYAFPLWMIRARHLSDAEYRSHLVEAGFVDVATTQSRDGWICATGRRPSA
jgi:SAM-dependent methyltransferase